MCDRDQHITPYIVTKSVTVCCGPRATSRFGGICYLEKGGACEEKSARVWVLRCSRITFWPLDQASCRAQGRPSPQGRCCTMQCVISNGPSTASTASRRVSSSGGRARREPPPLPSLLFTRPARA